MSVLDRSNVAMSASVWTWNVNMRTTLLEQQIERVLLAAPDVVCLQEVNPTALPLWTARLEAADYHVEASAPSPDAPAGRRLGVLIASRSVLTRVQQPIGVPWTERLLVGDVRLPGWPHALRVVCLHAPTRGKPGSAKILTLEAVSASLAALPDHVPAVLCGDLNAPQHEALDGTITTFGQTPSGYVHRGVGAREALAERTILRPPGWSDAFRSLHGYEVCGRSWRAHTKTNPGYRLDHILLSAHLKAVECAYDHDVRKERSSGPDARGKRLSDHSAMFASFELQGSASHLRHRDGDVIS